MNPSESEVSRTKA